MKLSEDFLNDLVNSVIFTNDVSDIPDCSYIGAEVELVHAEFVGRKRWSVEYYYVYQITRHNCEPEFWGCSFLAPATERQEIPDGQARWAVDKEGMVELDELVKSEKTVVCYVKEGVVNIREGEWTCLHNHP